jgi:hypothetical protein
MAFKGVTCAGQNVTPKNDRGLIQSHFTDGILWGCGMSVSGDDLVVAFGEIVAGGTIVFVDGSTNVDLSGRQYDTGYIQVILNVDLTKPEGEQIYTTYEESASVSGFSALTKDEIWATGTLYQLQLAIVQISGGNLSVYSTIGQSGIVANGGITTGGNIHITRASADTRINASADGGVLNIGKFRAGSAVGGINIDSADSAIVYGENGVYLRPNGQGDPTGQLTVGTDGSVGASGQITGGHPNTPKAPGGSVTVTSSMVSLTSITAGIVSGGVYLVTAECDYQPTASPAVAHYPQLEIQNSIKNTYYTATTGARHFCISGIVTGVSSIVFRGTTGTGSTNATVNNIVMNIVRLS